LGAGRVGTLIPHAVIGLLEKVFSILVAALAIEIMVEGGKALGIF
jgi:small neutral amino acid transporter SnatA (MarC family)